MLKLLACFFSFLALSVELSVEAATTECRIYSNRYNEYLFARRKLPIFTQRSVSLWKELKYRPFRECNSTFLFSDEDASGVWLFEPVNGREHMFFIRNKKYEDEYLRSSEKYQGMFGDDNRDVYVSKKGKADDERYMWKLSDSTGSGESSAAHRRQFLIKNVKLDRHLYARKMFFDFDAIDGPIILSIWDHSGLNSDIAEQFNWVLKCRDEITPS